VPLSLRRLNSECVSCSTRWRRVAVSLRWSSARERRSP